MKKIIMTEPLEYNSPVKVGNHQYAKLFAQNGYQVLWLSPIYNHLFLLKNREDFDERKSLHTKKFTKLDENIYGYCPYSLVLYGNAPIFNMKVMNKLSISLTIPNFIKVLKENDFFNVDILWLCNTKYYFLSELIDYKKLIYRCADDIHGFKNVSKSMIEFEEKLIKKSDCVFVTSKNLMKKKAKFRQDLVYLPNGVDLNNFKRKDYTIPDEFIDKNKKRCIYIGSINNWIDLELIKYSAKKLNDIDFFYIGPINIDIASVKNISNLYFIGPVDYKEIPNYLYYSDAALIPFKVNDFTNSITPVKLYEYMSVGLNVVTTNFQEMNNIESDAFISKDYDEFCENIKIALSCDNRTRNIEFAYQNTWDKRYEVLSRYL